MKAFRYNSENRADRKYNTCGMEKNPNAVKFYASNMDYANNYKKVLTHLYAFEIKINHV